ncbi:hypothetical protein Ping_2526 [Psychromonas ingrahamii 37]|uniref:Lipoprotein n=1 Tax=Psychromonas ingrahamii (strain DSM 17664 / CCUG 51855 / 37) TaxID=357804 RepID=A1SXN2_PSYIN|nr:hypothetical protein [Psychromonas ingrahamii]ABM04247.1 hypothetical protein Ping_2526 [Psychromonas ingrahamii 37]
MNKFIPVTLAAISVFVTGCSNTGSYPVMQQGSVLVSEVVSVCSAIVGGQAAQRINQEWAKYPAAEASRPMIESVAAVLLNNPDATAQQRTTQYTQYITCATGLFVTKNAMQ